MLQAISAFDAISTSRVTWLFYGDVNEKRYAVHELTLNANTGADRGTARDQKPRMHHWSYRITASTGLCYVR